MLWDAIPYWRFPIGQVGGIRRWTRCPDVRVTRKRSLIDWLVAKKAGAGVASLESDFLWHYTGAMLDMLED